MSRKVSIPRTCETCANYKPREFSRKEQRQIKRGRFEFAVPAPYAHSAAAVAPQPWRQERESEPAPALPERQLQPGESRTAEHRRPETLADVLTYVAKGGALGLGGMLFSAPFTVIDWWIFPAPWYTPLLVWPAVSGVGIFVAVFRPQEWLINVIEDHLQVDVDRDGDIADQPPQRILGTVRIDEPAKNRVRYVEDVPLSAEMGAWLTALLDGVHGATFSEASSADYGVGADDFGALRDKLIERGVIAWKNPRNHRSGYNEFNLAARHALAQFRELCACVRA